MAAQWLNAGIDYAAKEFLNVNSLQNLTVRLFVNNITPGPTDTASSYTECTLSGYSNVTLTPGSWSGSSALGVATYTYPTLTFTFSPYAGGTTIYGYFVTIPGVIGILAERFSTPYAVPAGGGSLTIDTTYQDG